MCIYITYIYIHVVQLYLFQIFLFAEGVVHCVRAAGHICTRSTMLITEIDATGLQLKPEPYLQWSITVMPSNKILNKV